MAESFSFAKQNELKVQKLANFLNLTMEDMATFSAYERLDDYVGFSIAFGFDLESFLSVDVGELDFTRIYTKGGYLDDMLSQQKGA